MLNYLFVYGTLRKAQNGRLHPYLQNRAAFVDLAKLPGKLYQIDTYPGAIPARVHSKYLVYGEVYRLFQPKQSLSILDEYEECAGHFPKPHEYQRLIETVTLTNGKRVQAWVYWFCHSTTGLQQITSGDYFDSSLTTNHKAKSK